MRPDLLVPVALWVAIVLAAFVVGRVRVGDWSPRRDVPVVLGVAALGAIAVGVVFAPPIVALLGVPVGLVLTGIYILTNKDRFTGTTPSSRRLMLWMGAGALVGGLMGVVLGILRLAP
ncbi:MAG TPA: hypothetical protein VGQ58_01735 [Candidatus Limnocylindrales bacterium]|jgi:hypothetical protein|nr:hypothetical protein [Candidatus Limnocylindrales bacterium]